MKTSLTILLLLTLAIALAALITYKLRPVPSGPERNSSERVSWETIEQAFQGCEVNMASQNHSLDVSVSLKNGRIYSSKEPRIDAIWRLVDEAKERCGSEITFITE